jgi:HK97 family phage major capsid protein
MMAMTASAQRRSTGFARAVFATAQARVNHGRVEEFLHKTRDEDALQILHRANAAPGSTTSTGFGAELQRDAFRDFLVNLAPYAAAARLIAQAVRASVGPVDETRYPIRLAGPTIPAWVSELGAIPIRSAAFTQVVIGPSKKMAHILVWSRELGKRSDAEQIFTQMLKEDIAAGIDSAFFASTAGSATQPAGLLFGVTPLTASGATGSVALTEDLSALASAVATGGSGSVTFVMNPQRLAMLRIIAPQLAASGDFVASAAVSVNRVVAVDGAEFLVAIDDAPEILQSEEAVIHMSDVPLPLMAAGVQADPQRSLWQTATVAARVIHSIDFVKRRSGAAAYLDGAGWN